MLHYAFSAAHVEFNRHWIWPHAVMCVPSYYRRSFYVQGPLALEDILHDDLLIERGLVPHWPACMISLSPEVRSQVSTLASTSGIVWTPGQIQGSHQLLCTAAVLSSVVRSAAHDCDTGHEICQAVERTLRIEMRTVYCEHCTVRGLTSCHR